MTAKVTSKMGRPSIRKGTTKEMMVGSLNIPSAAGLVAGKLFLHNNQDEPPAPPKGSDNAQADGSESQSPKDSGGAAQAGEDKPSGADKPSGQDEEEHHDAM